MDTEVLLLNIITKLGHGLRDQRSFWVQNLKAYVVAWSGWKQWNTKLNYCEKICKKASGHVKTLLRNKKAVERRWRAVELL